MEMSPQLAFLRQISPTRFVQFQLVCQLYLLCLSITACSVSSHLTSTHCSLPSSLSKRERQAGYSLLAFGLLQLLPSLVCVLVHLMLGYLARPLYVRLHIVTTSLLAVACTTSLVMIVRMVQEASAQQDLPPSLPHCLTEVTSWLPAMVPLLVVALICHLLTLVLLTTSNLVPGVKSAKSPPRVRLESNHTPVLVISKSDLGSVKNQILDTFSGRPELGPLSHRSLNSTSGPPTSPVLTTIPLTPCTDQQHAFPSLLEEGLQRTT